MKRSDVAALRGEPSYVWRAGQERRLQLIAKWTTLEEARVLVAGCGVGMYAHQIRQRFTDAVEAFDIELERVRDTRRRSHRRWSLRANGFRSATIHSMSCFHMKS